MSNLESSMRFSGESVAFVPFQSNTANHVDRATEQDVVEGEYKFGKQIGVEARLDTDWPGKY